MPFIFPDSSISTDYFTDNHASGGEGGSRFKFIRLEGGILVQLQVWVREWRISAVQFWMSDGTNYIAGRRAGTSKLFKFQDGERISNLNIQASGPFSSVLSRRRLGAIWFKTSKGREWGMFARNLNKADQYWPDVGSGVCCGMFGGAGHAIDRIGFAMLRPIKRSILTEIKYPNLNMEIVATTPDAVVTQTFNNCTSSDQVFTLKGKKSITVKREWSISGTLTKSLTLEVTAGIPGVGSGTAGSKWEISVTGTYSESETKVETMEWNWPIKCKAHTKVFGEATMFADHIETEYEGVIELKLNNGKSFKYKINGVYTGMNARSGTVTVHRLGPCLSIEDPDEPYEVSLWEMDAVKISEPEEPDSD